MLILKHYSPLSKLSSPDRASLMAPVLEVDQSQARGDVGQNFLIRTQAIANDSIRPLVGDFDLELIVTGLQRLSYIHFVRLLPQRTQHSTVDRHLSKIVYGSQIQHDFRTGSEPGTRRLEYS